MIRDAVARYATRFHRMLAGKHGVASPLGAWLLLALVAPAAEGTQRDQLRETLGCDVDEAFTAALDLLREPHAELVLGAAIWHDERVETDGLLALARRLAPPADAGRIPSQAEADAWAREHTLGLIEKFPIDLDPRVVLLLATAIATKVSWQRPFRLADPEAALLPAAPGFADLRLLRDPGTAEWQGIAEADVGLVGSFTARSQRGLLVTSVVADDAADPAEVLDTAQRIAIGVATGNPPRRRGLFELPLGDGAAWRITEGRAGASRERYEALLPAWEARSDHQLLADSTLGFGHAGQALIALLPHGDYLADAKQSAMARYHREGFEAAAVTGLAMRASAVVANGPTRTARVEFTRPHAVVAVTAGDGLWDGLPVFAAWVAQAVPAD